MTVPQRNCRVWSRTAGKLLLLITLLYPCGAMSQTRRGVTPEDYFRFENVGDPHISPDGSSVVFTITRVDVQSNRRVSEIWLVPTGGDSAPRRLTTGASSSRPRWSPDGNGIAFLSVRPQVEPRKGDSQTNAETQVYLLPIQGGECRRLTSLRGGVTDFAWSPDGAKLACVSRGGAVSSEGKERSDVRHYIQSFYKLNGLGYFDDRRPHIWMVETGSGAAKQLTFGDQRMDAEPQWSPDGSQIAFSSQATEEDTERSTDIFVIPGTGGQPTSITDIHGGSSHPRWSSDGKRIAFVGAQSAEDSQRIWIARLSTPARTELGSKELDRVVSQLEWAGGSNDLYYVAGDRGQQHIFRLSADSARIVPVTTGERVVQGMDLNMRTSQMVYGADDVKDLDELYASDLDGKKERRLTNCNAELWKELDFASVERLPFRGADGWPIDGFFMKPLDWQPGKRYPMVLVIHGGPGSMFGVGWFHEFQVYAAHGWAVFYANPRGSSGYGESFARGVNLEWGGKAYQDLMYGVDAALAKYPWIDQTKLGVTGGSYGGFMTNWIVTQTNRFRAAVTLRSISNFISIEGTRDLFYDHQRDFGGDLYENFDLYWRYSPIRYAKNVKTPVLILHSDNDQRVPLEQGEQWFRALKHFGVTTELVIFPRENHDLTRTGEPKHLVESLQWQVYWFERFLDGNERTIAPDRRNKEQ